jgi:hypothetical protein
MSDTNVLAMLASENPLSERTADRLELHLANVELLEEILAIPLSPHRSTPSRRPRQRRHGRLRGLTAMATAAAVIAGLALLLWPGDHGEGPAPAFAASLVRFARSTPLALLQLKGWHVVYADQEPGGFGELHFVNGPATADGTPRGASEKQERTLIDKVASLTWTPAVSASRRFVSGGREDARTGLGVTATRFVQEGRGPGWVDVSAQFLDGDRVLNFRATVSSMAMFRTELAALDAVGVTTWLKAMPPSVIKSADSEAVVRQMLKGIPLPPYFDAEQIVGSHLTRDRYQLGAAVTGTVACMWIADWSHARHAGDTATVNRAIAAMATAPHWPILRQMSHQGAWPQVLIGYAKAMPSGKWYGRPLTGDVNSGLGCSELGIDLNAHQPTTGFLPAPPAN